MRSKGILRGIFNVTESGVARLWRGAERFFIKANCSLLMSKENQKSTSFSRLCAG